MVVILFAREVFDDDESYWATGEWNSREPCHCVCCLLVIRVEMF